MKIEVKAQDENGITIPLVLDEDIADFEGLKKCLKSLHYS